VVSLQDDDESIKPMSTLSKKKKVKKIKKKKASVQPDFMKPPAYPEAIMNPSGPKEPYETNSSHGHGSDDGVKDGSHKGPIQGSSKPPRNRPGNLAQEKDNSSFRNAGR
jgi:hypothetical protein